MAKRFKLRFSRIILSFQSCRSKDPSTLPEDPVPSFLRLSPVKTHPKLIIDVDFPPPPPKPHRSSFKRHVSSAFTSVGCGLGTKPGPHYSSDHGHTETLPSQFKWQREEKWHVVAKVVHDDDDDTTPRRKIYNTSASENDDVFPFPPPPPPPPTAEKKKRRRKIKKTTSNRLRLSTSSAESGIFSSESWDDEREKEETETLVSSSRSFSTDSSSDFNPHLETIRETPISTNLKKKIKGPRKRGNRVKRRGSSSAILPENLSPARLSVFQRMIPCSVDGKVRESFAIVKKSEDPFGDFKRSMTEMIVEKEMVEERELEQLLQCFLSLNSRDHHGVIVDAFSEIWEDMFCRNLKTHVKL